MTNDLIIDEPIHILKNGAIKFYDAVYKGEPCYCTEHSKKKFYILISHDAEAMIKLKEKIERTGTPSISKRHVKFERNGQEEGIFLTHFIMAEYNKVPHDSLKGHRIELLDRSALSNNILDYRKENLFDRSGNRTEGVEIITRPNHPEEKYIKITRDNRSEIIDFSDEIYKILTTGYYSTITPNPRSDRLCVQIHIAKNKKGFKTHHLGRFMAMYNKYFKNYTEMHNSIEQFIKDSPVLSLAEKEFDGSHVNAIKWNNSNNNIMFMHKQTNTEMSRLILHFVGSYDAFPIVINDNGEEVILVEINHRGHRTYHRCRTPEIYCFMQKALLGKTPLLKELKVRCTNENMQTSWEISTPEQQYQFYKSTLNRTEDTSNIEDMLWEWCDRRDALIYTYRSFPEVFKEWKIVDEHSRADDLRDLFVNITPLLIGYITCGQ